MEGEFGFVVTGTSGLLGGRVAELLDREEKSTVSLGRTAPTHNLEKIRHITSDFSTQGIANGLPSGATFIHLAQSRHYSDFPAQAKEIFSVNVASTIALASSALETSAKTFLLASTGGVYRGSLQPLTEDSRVEPQDGLSFYVSSKLSAEMLLNGYSDLFNVIIPRYFFIYGPGQSGNMLVPRLISKVLRGEEIIVDGASGVSVNPIFAEDAAQATLLAAARELTGILNISGNESVTIVDLVDLIGDLVGIRPKIKRSGKPVLHNLVGDNTKMSSSVWEPLVDLRRGITLTLEKDFRNF